MKPTIARIVTSSTLAIALALLPGCASTGTNFNESNVSRIKKGETTEAELVKLFGSPERRNVDSEGTTHLTWSYIEARMKGEAFIPIAGAFMGGSRSNHKMLSVTLGPDGKVTRFTSSGGGSETRHMTQESPKK